ncbi:hypothetical protein GCM10022225_33620 [Plantactinospora mayteni]|uniref:Lactococcin 972 family bacteriocin n=1 Tax=Plantactinospora mayteni TaxID=566021 RepID=A0ABQ4EL72_9ACTN|nr:hypothetical protein [Plantactinospora mayteni]GIG95474.1 hypothetical protein Pma05_20470 [Plantactinospora mayteni]
MSSSNRGLRTGLRTKLAGGLGAAGLLVAASLAMASPAQAACAYDYTSHGFNSSYAEAETADCSYWSNSYAQHGGSAIYSGWYSVSSWARADVGVSFSHNADNFFS